MLDLKRLIEEIHSRSLWHVTLIYVGGAWVCYEIIDTITDRLALPAWFPATALILFLVGLPFVLATAFVQEGGPLRGRADPTLIPESSDPQLAGSPTSGARRLFAWRNVLFGGMVGLALWGVAAAGWMLFGDRSETSGADRKSVAVLPFVNLSGDPENEYFSDGITGDIINHLSKIADLKVTSRTSAFQYKDANQSLREIARQLDVATIVEGEVQRVGDRVRINAQLIDAGNDVHLWSEQYNRNLTDVFAIQSEVALNIARALASNLTVQEEQRIRRNPSESAEAYNQYLLGRFWRTKRTSEGLEKAVEYFEQSLEEDSSFALGYAALADSYFLLGYWGNLSRDDVVSKVRSAAREALARDSTLAEAYAALGGLAQYYSWSWDEAEKYYQRAIALNPGYATAHQWYGILLVWLGRHEESLSEFERARELDPLSPNIINNLAIALHTMGRYEEAIERIQKGLEIAPDFRPLKTWLGSNYLELGMYEEAIETFPPNNPRLTAAYSALGMTEEAQAVLEQAKQGSLYVQLFAYVGMGQIDAAFDVLERMLEERSIYLAEMIGHKQPYFRVLQSDPRYDRYRRATGLP